MIEFILIVLLFIFIITKERTEGFRPYKLFSDGTENIPLSNFYNYSYGDEQVKWTPVLSPLEKYKTNWNAFKGNRPHIGYDFINSIKLSDDENTNDIPVREHTCSTDNEDKYEPFKEKLLSKINLPKNSLDSANVMYGMYQGKKIKQNIDGMNSLTKKNFKRFFEREFADNERRIWWEEQKNYDREDNYW